MTDITAERIERLKGQVPPGVDAKAWKDYVTFLDHEYDADGSHVSVIRHDLRCLIADADARDAGPIDGGLLESLAEIKCNAELWIYSGDARAILARAGLGVSQ